LPSAGTIAVSFAVVPAGISGNSGSAGFVFADWPIKEKFREWSKPAGERKIKEKKMTVNDPIAEMFSRINNAINVNYKSVVVPFSQIKLEIVKILKKEGYIKKYEVKEEGNFKQIHLDLAYDENGQSVITQLKKISRPGRRGYVKSRDIQPVLDGFGTAIISTSSGLMVGREARRKKLGGEIIAQVF
jgi:small subunit ribosomal protein S8